jgi:mannose-6-phosphate isomerase-like protein (cupin superfamily)
MDVQRRGSESVENSLYDGAGVLTLETYFTGSRLPASVMRYWFEPGTSEGVHLHSAAEGTSCSPHDSEELYLVVSGELVMTIDGVRTTLSAGDAAYAPTGALHGIANESDGPAELVLVFGPPVSDRQ